MRSEALLPPFWVKISIILNNSAMGIYSPENFPTANGLYGTKYTGVNFSQVAKPMESYNEQVSQPELLGAAMKRCVEMVQASKPTALEVVTKEEPNMPHRIF